MARTSKKAKKASTADAVSKVYSAAIYARLSVEGDDRKNESIETQIEIAKAYLMQQNDMILFDCYTDLGKTGTNFARDGFERMMQDVRMRKIDCIIVKDLSRFGRNHIETGNYIEKIFPFLGVRFIAVTDNFDSANPSDQNETMGVNLKNLVNEMYARDIAIKVKSSKREKWEQGCYTGGIAAYGYEARWVDGKKTLFIDEEPAKIVRKIFELYGSDMNMKQIVAWLYKEKVLRPNEYRSTGHVYQKKGDILREWSRETLKDLFTNPAYIGCLAQGRTCGRDYKQRSRFELDPEDYSIKENTHEAIVTDENFVRIAEKLEQNRVRRNADNYSTVVPSDEDVFKDIAFCGDCGRNLQRVSSLKKLTSGQRIRTYGYICRESKRIDKYMCPRKHISLIKLTEIVKTALRQEFAFSTLRQKDLVEINYQEAQRTKEDLQRQRKENDNKIEKIKKQSSEQYLKYRMGKVDVITFQKEKEENEKKIISLQKEQIAITAKLGQIDNEMLQKGQFLRTLLKCNEKTEFTGDILRTLIHRIEVYPDKRVKIIFAFQRKDIAEHISGSGKEEK